MDLTEKFEKDYQEYLKVCNKHNEVPRTKEQDFYKHKRWLIEQHKY